MSTFSPVIVSKEQLMTDKKRIKALKNIAEAVGEQVVTNSICINAIKIDRINAKLLKSSDHLFKGKIVKQGIIRKEVYYVDPKNRLRFLSEDVPFMMTFNIPGLRPESDLKIHDHLVNIDVKYHLIPAKACLPGSLKQIIVVQIIIKVSKWRQVDVITGISHRPMVNTYL